jgi:hypothetical protein
MTIIRSVSLTEAQDKYMKRRNISISQFVRQKIDEDMKLHSHRIAGEPTAKDRIECIK